VVGLLFKTAFNVLQLSQKSANFVTN